MHVQLNRDKLKHTQSVLASRPLLWSERMYECTNVCIHGCLHHLCSPRCFSLRLRLSALCAQSTFAKRSMGYLPCCRQLFGVLAIQLVSHIRDTALTMDSRMYGCIAS